MLISPLRGGGIRLGIIGHQGSMVEAVGIDVDQAFPFIVNADAMLEISLEARQRLMARYDRERDRRWREALKRNSWLNPTASKVRPDPNETYIGRPQ